MSALDDSVVSLNILRKTHDEVVCGASLIHKLFRFTVSSEQTNYANTQQNAGDTSELNWVSWVRWLDKWRTREVAFPMCLPTTLRILNPANLFCNIQCTTVCITAAGSRVAKRTPLVCSCGLPQRVARQARWSVLNGCFPAI